MDWSQSTSTEYTPAGPLNNWGGTGDGSSTGIPVNVVQNEYESTWQPYRDILTQLLQQNDSPASALDYLKAEIAAGNTEYKELYYQLLAERENNADAWKRYEDFNNSYYQRTTKDLEKAGLNPWLALQSLGSSGSGSISTAGTWSSSALGNKASQQQAEASQMKAVLSVVGVIAAALIYAML